MPEPWIPSRLNSRAVLIGAGTFPSADLPDLPAVAHNLDALEQVLTDPQHGVIGGCAVLADRDVTDANIGAAITKAAREASDLLLVYYAGHGVLDDGRLRLARPDTSMDHVGWTSVSVDLLKRDLGQARARARVLVLDCCFSGLAVTAMADSRSLVAGQLNLSGTYTLASTTATTPSYAPPGKRYTSFTDALLGALAQPDPLTLDDIYRRIDFELESLGLPRPQHNATNNAASLVLTRGPVIPDTKRPERKESAPESEPITRLTYATTPTTSYTSQAGVVGAMIGSLGLFIVSIAIINSHDPADVGPSALLLPFVVGPVLGGLLGAAVGSMFQSAAKGRVEIDPQYLTVRRGADPLSQVPWSVIHKIRVSEVERHSLLYSKIEIELHEMSDRRPGSPFTRVPDRDRPTYQFGDIDESSGRFASALREMVGGSTFVEER